MEPDDLVTEVTKLYPLPEGYEWGQILMPVTFDIGIKGTGENREEWWFVWAEESKNKLGVFVQKNDNEGRNRVATLPSETPPLEVAAVVYQQFVFMEK